MVQLTEPTLTSTELVARTRALLNRSERVTDTLEPSGPEEEPVRRMLVAMGGLASPPARVARGGVAGRAGTLLKRTVRKLAAWYVEPRWSAQATFDEEVVGVARELGRFRAEVRAAQGDLAGHTAAFADQVAGLADEVTAVRAQLDEHAAELSALRRAVSVYVTPDVDYVAFEERFRGGSEQIKAAQRDYLGRFVSATAGGPIIDIGCGRGEMLELFAEAGLEALGIDTDEGMVEECRRKGLSVERADGLAWLRDCGDSSLRGIFLAQVVEHLSPLHLVELVQLAARKISPGGALVAETIDPRSLYATANFFWADLSHVRPVHPATLAFLAEQAGFAQVAILGRSPHEHVALAETLADTPEAQAVRLLLDEVYGHQDYAMVANR